MMLSTEPLPLRFPRLVQKSWLAGKWPDNTSHLTVEDLHKVRNGLSTYDIGWRKSEGRIGINPAR